jgi:hypothetical protein
MPFYRLEVINNLELKASGFEDRFNFAYKIALDLFEYMTSFSQGNNQGKPSISAY